MVAKVLLRNAEKMADFEAEKNETKKQFQELHAKIEAQTAALVNRLESKNAELVNQLKNEIQK